MILRHRERFQIRRCAATVGLVALILSWRVSLPAAQDDPLASPSLRIAWSDFKKLYDAGKVVVIDVRGEEAFNAGHIPGARSIPLARIEKSVADLKKLTKPIVLYCA